MAGKEQLSPDEVEEAVLSELPKLAAVQLEAACGAVSLAVLEAVKGNKKALRKQLTNYLDDDEDRATEFGALYDLFFPNTEKPDDQVDASIAASTANSGVKVEPTDEKLKHKALKSTLPLKKSEASGSGVTKKSTGEEKVTVSRSLRKDFKLSGMIGGTSESSLSYVSLQFEIKNGRKLGHSDDEICSAVIAKVADKELRSYFVTESNLDLDAVLDMLKSVCTEEKSSAVFTIFTNDKQAPNEKAISFITRVLKLRKKIMKLGREEGRSYDEEMLAERSFEVILGGLRDENIRSALRDKLRYDTTLEDKEIMKLAADVIAAEKERKLKLFGKAMEAETDDVEVNEVTSDFSRDSGRGKSVSFEEKNNQGGTKKKLNPFAEIEELRSQMKSNDDRMTAQLNEIKQLVLSQKQEDNKKEPGEKPPNKCPACHAANKWRCFHCWFCGDKNHKLADCPENS